ncbi:hypothetical protein Acr_12g0010760 [Actinidia rufa]|uniref:Uncharacterized protein n=1 Tax=Actinidia rufa TaxID=165716 RepID=A0A7J0FIM5_9ERIC|nr:hypothetical protein Acr_12g0010760 [Actinidia rufa]
MSIKSGIVSRVYPHVLAGDTEGEERDRINWSTKERAQKHCEFAGPISAVLPLIGVAILSWDAIVQRNLRRSLQNCHLSIIFFNVNNQQKQIPSKVELQKMIDSKGQKTIMLRSLGTGFGNLTAAVENIRPGSEGEKLPEAAEIFAKAASNCCGRLCNHCCCMCCIQPCSWMNNQCAVALTQLCGALTCLGCFTCCEDCCSGHDG